MKKYTLILAALLFPLINFSQEKGLDKKIDEAFQPVSDFFNNVVFFTIGDNPFVIYLLVGSALFLLYILDFQMFDTFLLQLML